jgi:hypothetical protein
MGSLYLHGDWSYCQLGDAFDSDHKTVIRSLASLNLFLGGNPTPEAPTPEEGSDLLRDLCHSIERYFIPYKLLENPSCSARKISKTMSKLPLLLSSSPSSVWSPVR